MGDRGCERGVEVEAVDGDEEECGCEEEDGDGEEERGCEDEVHDGLGVRTCGCLVFDRLKATIGAQEGEKMILRLSPLTCHLCVRESSRPLYNILKFPSSHNTITLGI